jgi:uncharacterized protein YdhG (YjbR/CyaY superfamily)
MSNADDPVGAYIAGYPEEIRTRLQQLRDVIRQAAPQASELISYAMPTFKGHGNLVHFAVHTHHIGFYPGGEPLDQFAAELDGFTRTKGGIQLPFDRPLPLEVIRRIVELRVQRDSERAATQRERRRASAAVRRRRQSDDAAGG